MITINWGNEDKTVMQYEFEGSWTIEDLIDALDAGVEVVNRYDHAIDVVVDLSQSGFPNLFGVNVTKAFQGAFNRSEEHAKQHNMEPGMVVIVTKNPIIRTSLKSMLAVYPSMGSSTISVADTVQEANEKISAFRQRTVFA